MSSETLLDFAGAAWLFFCWLGYTEFARRRAKTHNCLSSVLHVYRKRWMLAMLTRENRIGDAALIASLERNTSFLASTSMFIIAGLITIIASADQVYMALLRLPIANNSMNVLQLQLKIVLLLAVYVYAFFTLTWALRQFGFASVLLGAAPMHDDFKTPPEDKTQYAINLARVIDRAGHSYNYGLRAYYFSLSVLPWFLNSWLFMATVASVVLVLYRREFHSRTLHVMAADASRSMLENEVKQL